MAIDQDKLKARRARQNEARKQRRINKQIVVCAKSVSSVRFEQMKGRGVRAASGFDSPKVIAHNADLHKTSACLAEEARATERAIDRKRWSHAL